NQTMISSSWDSNQDPVNGYIPATGSIRFWRMSDGALLKTYDKNTGTSANALSVSPDGKLFSYSHDSTVFVARVPAADCVASISPGSANFPATGGSSSMTGLLIIAAQTFPVHLGADPCTYAVSPTDVTWAPNGGTGSVDVQSTGGCGWSANSNAHWITITKISRDSGSGGVT